MPANCDHIRFSEVDAKAGCCVPKVTVGCTAAAQTMGDTTKRNGNHGYYSVVRWMDYTEINSKRSMWDNSWQCIHEDESTF